MLLPEPSTLLFFCAAAVVLLVMPGPAVLYIVTRSLDQGRLAGFVSIMGLGVSTLVHIGAAAFGVSALLLVSSLAFNVLKYLGAAYLIFLGVQKLLDRNGGNGANERPARSLRRVFVDGIVVNLFNPKAALFFFAFLPQFVDPARGSAAVQVLLLGLIFLALATVSDTLYVLLAGWVRDAYRRRGQRGMAAGRWVTGGVFIGLGLVTAFAGSGRE